jgi:hypothetical protein
VKETDGGTDVVGTEADVEGNKKMRSIKREEDEMEQNSSSQRETSLGIS